ncbi:MAG: DUF4124 domain-containing protein [Pseudomonadota bacterium]
MSMHKYAYMLIPVFCLFSMSLPAEQVYRSIDEEGNIIFSDQAVTDQSEKIDIKPANSINFEQLSNQRKSNKEKDAEEQKDKQIITITQPVNEQTIRDNQGALLIELNIEPRLPTSSSIVVEIDGIEKYKGKATKFDLLNIERGSHTIQAFLIDQLGNKVVSSDSAVFYMHRASKLLREQQNASNEITPLNPPTGQSEVVPPLNLAPTTDNQPTPTL